MSKENGLKPPKHSQFKKGVSGNPKGRPKGSRNLKTELAEELGERVVIQEDGKVRRISKQRAMIKASVNRAIAGDQRAAANVFNMTLRVMAEEATRDETVELSDSQQTIFQRFRNRMLSECRDDVERRQKKSHD